jgi:hypothetical protein
MNFIDLYFNCNSTILYIKALDDRTYFLSTEVRPIPTVFDTTPGPPTGPDDDPRPGPVFPKIVPQDLALPHMKYACLLTGGRAIVGTT